VAGSPLQNVSQFSKRLCVDNIPFDAVIPVGVTAATAPITRVFHVGWAKVAEILGGPAQADQP
jgi:hypothetical protein